MGEKIVIYENELKQKVVFDNGTLFCESIDMTGTSGIHGVERLAFADGQTTVSHQLSAKTIPCSFAFKNINDDDFTADQLANIFNPKIQGTLTVITRNHTYKMDVSPQNFPVFRRDKVSFIYRFDVDFVSDETLWLMDKEHPLDMTANEKYDIDSNCPYNIPLKIVFPSSNEEVTFEMNANGFTLTPHSNTLTVNTKTFRITNNNNMNQSQFLKVNNDIKDFCLKYGSNWVRCTSDVQISYYNLSNGEI